MMNPIIGMLFVANGLIDAVMAFTSFHQGGVYLFLDGLMLAYGGLAVATRGVRR